MPRADVDALEDAFDLGSFCDDRGDLVGDRLGLLRASCPAPCSMLTLEKSRFSGGWNGMDKCRTGRC